MNGFPFFFFCQTQRSFLSLHLTEALHTAEHTPPFLKLLHGSPKPPAVAGVCLFDDVVWYPVVKLQEAEVQESVYAVPRICVKIMYLPIVIGMKYICEETQEHWLPETGISVAGDED